MCEFLVEWPGSNISPIIWRQNLDDISSYNLPKTFQFVDEVIDCTDRDSNCGQVISKISSTNSTCTEEFEYSS